MKDEEFKKKKKIHDFVICNDCNSGNATLDDLNFIKLELIWIYGIQKYVPIAKESNAKKNVFVIDINY